MFSLLKNNLVALLIILNVIFTIVIGLTRGPETGILPQIRAIILLLIIFYYFFQNKSNIISTYVNIYIIYLSLLLLFTSELIVSFSLYLKFIISLVSLPIAFYYIDTLEKYKRLLKVYILSIIILSCFIIAGNIFGFGISAYDAYGGLTFGLNENITKPIIIIMIVLLVSLKLFNNNRWISYLFLINMFIVIVALKRGVLLTLASGVLIYYIYTEYKTKYLKYTALIFAIALLLSPFYIDIIEERFLAREERIQGIASGSAALENEARYLEYFRVIDAFNSGDIFHKLFGSEIFNDRYFYKINRMLHTDFMILLNGTGIIGLMFFFGLYLIIYSKFRNYNRYNPTSLKELDIKAVFYVMLIAPIFLSLSSTVYDITLRTLILVFLGATLRIVKEENNKYLLNKINAK